MLTPIAVLLLIFAAVFFLVLNLFKSLIKAITITLLIMFLAGIFISYTIIMDAKEFSNTINKHKTTYLLDENGNIQTGFQASKLNMSSFEALDENQIEEIQQDPQGKIFIIKKEILYTNSSPLELNLSDLSIDAMLQSASANQRAQAFALSLGTTIKEEGVIKMILHIKDEDILIEPKTPVVLVITSTPRQIYKQAKTLIIKEANKRLNNVRKEVNI